MDHRRALDDAPQARGYRRLVENGRMFQMFMESDPDGITKDLVDELMTMVDNAYLDGRRDGYAEQEKTIAKAHESDPKDSVPRVMTEDEVRKRDRRELATIAMRKLISVSDRSQLPADIASAAYSLADAMLEVESHGEDKKPLNIFWCKTHEREATYPFGPGKKCDPSLGGILGPCVVEMREP
ncbi:MAG: hypothetical protein IH951_11760 [Bacteroidetes bacterium]|nr:hypothetical protein [Bacteroidota bacterium]